MNFAHTVVLPGLHLAGHELHFFCDLTRYNAMDELLATCDTWLDLKEFPVAPRDLLSEEDCYDWAQEKMRATLLSLRSDAHRQRVLDRVMKNFLGKYQFPEVEAAFTEHFHADLEPQTQSRTPADCLH